MKIVEIGYKEKVDWTGHTESYILFDNGEKLSSEHNDDCCEQVYADFQNMQVMGQREKNYVDSNELDFFENILDSIVPIEGLGFYLVSKQGICLLVSCYNVQNGYYSDYLELNYMGKTKNISSCVPDCRYTKDEIMEENVKRIEELKGVEGMTERGKGYAPHGDMKYFICPDCGCEEFTTYAQSVPADRSKRWTYEFVCAKCGRMMGLILGTGGEE